VLLSLFAAQYSDFSLSHEYHPHPLMMHLSTPQHFTWSKNCTRTPFRKTLMEQIVYIFGQKRTHCFDAIKK